MTHLDLVESAGRVRRLSSIVYRPCPQARTALRCQFRPVCPALDVQTPVFMSHTHATTVLALRHQGKVVLASDGQVTLGQTVVKHHARKVRRLYQDRVLAGFAGTASDGFALFARFESKLEA